jgi:Zn-dependent protease with chaperone function
VTEVWFPLLGAALLVSIVLPACALLAKALLALVERTELGGPLQALNLRYVLLISSSFVPLAWFLSAALHQAESGKFVLACLFDHEAASLCFEPGFFALTVLLVMLGCALPALRGLRPARTSSTLDARGLALRIGQLVATRPALKPLAGRVLATDEAGFALGTYGFVEPRVIVGVAFAARLTDDMLAAALGHELEHVRLLDPLRFLLLRIALALNPLGRGLLAPHVACWFAAREATCDREAVLDGAQPLALADAIVRAARPSKREAVALGARDTEVLRFRVGMLLAYAERVPARASERGPGALPWALGVLLLTLFLPHQTGTAALDILHTGTEHTLTYFFWH